MTGKKMELSYISNDMVRKISYMKRKKSIIKKVSELTTLCGIPACAIISSPFDSQPEIWPNLERAKDLAETYQNASVKDKSKNVNLESSIVHMISKARDKQNKLRQQIREKELTMTIFECVKDETLPEGLTIKDANDINMLIEKMMKEIDVQIAALN